MNLTKKLILPLVAGLLLMTVGCANYVITHELEQPIPVDRTCKIRTIVDELPADIEAHKRPSWEDISKLEGFISEEFEKRKIMTLIRGASETDYEIEGSILQYKKGSGLVRFITLNLAGNAKILVNLKLIGTGDSTVVFGGNFNGYVTQWEVSGEEMFKQVAKDFARQLEKRLKKLRKEQEKAQG